MMSIAKYRQAGLKLTPQRMAILDYLKENRQHPSAEEIFKYVSRKFPTMSFATVYNTLETLERQGSLMVLIIDPNRKRYDTVTAPHHHLFCTSCKKIADLERDYELEIPEDERLGFKIFGNRIEFYGLCPQCKDNAADT
ncbi:MAG: transcriptional repressor [Nitrospirae bacterium]|nr:transcriptional repressor [Nitrospirota bacterium]MBF0534648.1 transcriptional repressor [Nitrospirota bacterium]MBF0616308.1 transcriptional repressor [Nitrospirota bacterium]